MSEKPLLIVYGNCQASAITHIFRLVPFVRERFEVRYTSSFDPGIPNQPTREETERCELLYEQYDPQPFPHREALPSGCETVIFPAIDFNTFWPWGVANPYGEVKLSPSPREGFAYGDTVLIACIEQGMDDDMIIQYYLEQAWQKHMPPIERLLSLERARLETREKHCDVTISAYIFDRFRDTRLHWTANHPTTTVLCETAMRLLRATFPEAQDFERSELIHHTRTYIGEPLGHAAVPIHPELARALELRWYRTNTDYPHYGTTLSLEAYLRAYVAHARAHPRRKATPRGLLIA